MTERKFTTLRKRLDQLGYRQALGIESVPLVEKLFSDLVHTTESLKNLKLQVGKQETQRTVFEDNVEPYRSDNAKLVKENNELHLQLIKLREETDHVIRDLKTSVRKLEHENADLKFLNTQYVHKVKALEKENKAKTERIQDLQEKNLHAVVETPGGRRKQIPLRRQRMDIESTVSPARDLSGKTDDMQDPYVADLLSVADTRIEELQAQLSQVQDEKSSSERRNKSLRKQVETRDKEIERLNRLLDGGRPVDAVLREGKKDSSERVVAHLNVQVDYLQQANHDLEKQLKDTIDQHVEATRRANDLEGKNAELLLELKDINRLSKQVEEDKQRDVGIVRSELVETKAVLKNLQHQEGVHRTEMQELRKERQHLMEENERLAVLVDNAEHDVRHVTELLDKSDKERKRLSDRNAQLTMNERELVMDLERLKLAKSVKPKKSRDKSPSKIESLVTTLEKERDYYKSECETLQDMMRRRLTAVESPATKRKGGKGKAKTVGHLESMTQLLQEERDFYKRECELLRNMKEKSVLMSPPTRERVSRDSPSEVNRLRRERDELQSLVEKFEKHLTEIQENVKTLTQDRDNIQLLYEQATDEIQRLRRQVSQARSPSPSRAASAVLTRVESERDEALAELRRTNTQLDNLEDKSKALKESGLQERRRYEDKIERLESMLEKVEADRNELHTRVTSLRNMVSNLEDQLKQTTAQLSMAKDSGLELEAEVNKVQLTADQANRTAEDMERRLNRRAGELQASEEKCAQLERRLEEVEKRNAEQSFETAEIRATLKSLDRERDDLQQQVDEKTEEIMNLEAKKIQSEKAESELKMNMEDVEARLSHAIEQGGLKDREIKSLRRQLDSRDDELAEMTRGREVALKENRRLQTDLNTMTEEHQAIHQQLQEALEEQESLKVQISEYARQVARVEELLAQKEQEKEELLEQYRVLSSETERLVSESKVSAGKVTNYHMELVQKQRSEMELSDKIRRLESEIQQYGASHQAYDIQVSSLTRSLAQMEEQLRLANEDRENMMQDLTAVRELCMKLDQTRESLSRQLAAKSLDQEQMRELLEDAKSETDNLRKKVFSEKEAVRSLEGVLARQREKEYVGKKSLETTIEEVDRLKDRLTKTDQEKSYQRQEVNTLRKASERLEDEVTKLKKQLANEKYERERLLQETTRRERDVTGSASRESLTSRYSRNTDQRLHTSFSSGEFARLKPKDMSSPLASDHSDSGRRIISPIRRRSDDDDFSDAS
ncbi:centrosomal protein of 135 kDa-like isoform X1 [Orbicella faveolata]|uniref:centrosomal protein of 135 kDa-like isoform X1 n=1 Tax=Orbicella faveolata TaxID=48498 RepID=UPI0009E21D25|nr:centrosomal protein of 135 kDa-like isoform X1 [Orbicella faveolata]